MMLYRFSLRFQLPAPGEEILTALRRAGCGDATLGIGRSAVLALNFEREATTLQAAMDSAVGDVQRAIPDAALISPQGEYR